MLIIGLARSPAHVIGIQHYVITWCCFIFKGSIRYDLIFNVKKCKARGKESMRIFSGSKLYESINMNYFEKFNKKYCFCLTIFDTFVINYLLLIRIE